MKIPLKFLINERFVRKNGTCLIYIQYSFNRECRPLLNTGIEIPPAFWDKKLKTIRKDLPSRFGSVEELNLQLLHNFRVAEDLVIFASKAKVIDLQVLSKINSSQILIFLYLTKLMKKFKMKRSPII